MTIWDDGRYELEKWRESEKDGEVIFTAEGRPGGPLGRVRLALIRTDGEGEKSTWLLHRMKTDAAGRPQTDGEPVEASEQADEATAPREAELRPMIATAATPGLARDAARRWDPWVEVKWDGIRAVGVWDGRRLHLRARSGNDITAKYPELTRVDAGLGSTPAVIDGEIVALDHQGRPSFPRLQARMNLSKPREIDREAPLTPVHYYLYDVLALGDQDVAALPLAQRRGILEDLGADAI